MCVGNEDDKPNVRPPEGWVGVIVVAVYAAGGGVGGTDTHVGLGGESHTGEISDRVTGAVDNAAGLPKSECASTLFEGAGVQTGEPHIVGRGRKVAGNDGRLREIWNEFGCVISGTGYMRRSRAHGCAICARRRCCRRWGEQTSEVEEEGEAGIKE